jgi:hypothetical protein
LSRDTQMAAWRRVFEVTPISVSTNRPCRQGRSERVAFATYGLWVQCGMWRVGRR